MRGMPWSDAVVLLLEGLQSTPTNVPEVELGVNLQSRFIEQAGALHDPERLVNQPAHTAAAISGAKKAAPFDRSGRPRELG